ncbi:RNA polymerase sigma factor SigF [Gloeothece verrucosa]|uniref:RNA polymerase, sigma 28 subunit, FliA/WhiG subfamily n=1 Tax=Gloeothece verrucosa (strain PCC 7822) TaxID=497965 RepID=E0UGW5_GLOV7|nr:RNA polymerase sigma factor SigF [Gloeothece verrucosa]ADN14446.1 RNA polymerase, sigma 28 subunit, FliA/WhiG subfamily [Gloeothece verrucosa PCC 7822]
MTTQSPSLGIQIMEVLIAYSRNPSLKLRNQLVELNAGLVRQVAHRISRQCCEPYEDLEQVGYLGLIRAIERFNPQQGCAFSSFAIPYVRGEILHYLRDRGSVMRIPRRWQDLYTKGKKLRKQLAQTLGRQPKESEIAQALGVSYQEWNECQLALQNRLLVSLDATINQVHDGVITFGDTLPDPKSQGQQRMQEDRLQLQRAMSQLEDKTKAAIECVFLWDLPRKEAAKQIGISPMTVTRHLQKGLEQLIALLRPQAA